MSGRVYDPIAGAATGADNYNVYYNYTSPGGCTATDINTTLNNGMTWTVLISLKATGNAVVSNVFNIKTTTVTSSYETIYAFHLGKLMSGSYSPASTSTSTSTGVNKPAVSAQLQANGLPPLP